MRLRTLACLSLAAAASLWLGAARGAPQAEPEAAAAADASLCAACHEDQVAALAHGPHAALDRDGLAAMAGAADSCAACHGDATAHLEAGGGAETMFAFGDAETATAKSQACLACHGDAHPSFLAGPHAAAGLDCTSCHGIHSNTGTWSQLKAGTAPPVDQRELGEASASCYSCHGDVFAQFQFNERHRLNEGILDCTSCHDPHGRSDRVQLGGFKHEMCVSCHTDKGGPFVFEHAASRVEGCVACHSPHGSPNRHLMPFQRVTELCYSCHAVVPGFHSRFTLETVCTNCHSSIHGSNFDPFFLK
jgi:DmsE family decaheme c-type cytochrome